MRSLASRWKPIRMTSHLVPDGSVPSAGVRAVTVVETAVRCSCASGRIGHLDSSQLSVALRTEIGGLHNGAGEHGVGCAGEDLSAEVEYVHLVADLAHE